MYTRNKNYSPEKIAEVMNYGQTHPLYGEIHDLLCYTFEEYYPFVGKRIHTNDGKFVFMARGKRVSYTLPEMINFYKIVKNVTNRA